MKVFTVPSPVEESIRGAVVPDQVDEVKAMPKGRGMSGDQERHEDAFSQLYECLNFSAVETTMTSEKDFLDHQK